MTDMTWAQHTTDQLAEQARRVMTQIGLSHRLSDGRLLPVTFDLVGVTRDARYGVLQVDMQRLPPRVKVAQIVHPDTLHELTANTGYHWGRLNTVGATLCVELDADHRRALPRCVELDLDTRPAGDYLIPLGMGAAGAVWRSLLETSHILIGGESRSGKTTLLNAMLAALLAGETPERLRLALFDPKSVELVSYTGLPHLYAPIVRGRDMVQGAVGLMRRLEIEMDEREQAFLAVRARNLSQYNHKSPAPLPLIGVVIDEATDLSLQAGDPFTRPLIRLASKGAAFGIVLIIATQHPKADILDTLIKGNLSTRIAFRVATVEQSRTILGLSGAQDLPRTVRGRMLARLDADLVELQGFYVPDDQIERLTDALRGGALNEQDLAPAVSSPQALSDLQVRLVQYALDELDGAFVSNKIAEVFQSEISARGIKSLASEWEQRGWLSAPRYQGDARHVTEELAALAGSLDRWSESVSQRIEQG